MFGFLGFFAIRWSQVREKLNFNNVKIAQIYGDWKHFSKRDVENLQVFWKLICSHKI